MTAPKNKADVAPWELVFLAVSGVARGWDCGCWNITRFFLRSFLFAWSVRCEHDGCDHFQDRWIFSSRYPGVSLVPQLPPSPLGLSKSRVTHGCCGCDGFAIREIVRIVGQKADAVGLGAVEERSEEAIADWEATSFPYKMPLVPRRAV